MPERRWTEKDQRKAVAQFHDTRREAIAFTVGDVDGPRRDLQPFPTYYIDTETGVIGDPTNLVFLDFVPTGMDEEADSVITNYGKDHGTPLDRLL